MVEASGGRARADRLRGLWDACWAELRSPRHAETAINESTSRTRRLRGRSLVVLSLAGVIGAGITENARTALQDFHGPNTLLGLVVSAVASYAAALCFAELASTIPVSGSSFTYVHVTFNQAFAFVVAWVLLIEYAVGAFVIALSWSRFVTGDRAGSIPLAVLLVAVCAVLLSLVGRERVWRLVVVVAVAAVVVKVGYLVVASVAGFAEGRVVPVGTGVQLPGVVAAFGVLYYSFIGFDAPSTAAEDTRYPQRDLARSILVSLTIVSALYLVFTISGGFSTEVGTAVTQWGALLGLPAGVLVFLYGGGRIMLAVVRDGLIGRRARKRAKHAAATRERSWRPESVTAGALGVLVSLALIASGLVGDLLPKFVNVATGAAFAVVAVGTVVLRVRRPDLPRTFSAPLLPLAATVAVAASCVLVASAPEVLPHFVGWVVLGVLLYLVILVVRVRARRADAERAAAGRAAAGQDEPHGGAPRGEAAASEAAR